MFTPNPDDIRHVAENMIRNFGFRAVREAEDAAKRQEQHPDGHALWLEIAREIRAIQDEPSVARQP